MIAVPAGRVGTLRPVGFTRLSAAQVSAGPKMPVPGLAYLTARLGDEIAHMKGKRAPFAPHWPLPDQIAHRLKREVPVWAIG
ncbi:hypothetical protein, partial [Streptomyces sp. NPDC005568]|uniref:hypothetical protein n=1 Tax=Streptomyces sp. NPDC005568 TaxID=3156887 RepID=UPI0033BF9DC2